MRGFKAAAVVMVFGLAATCARADVVALKDVPEEAKTAAAKAAPSVDKWLIAFSFTGKVKYKLIARNNKDRLTAYLWSPTGDCEVQIEIPQDEVPAGVQSAVSEKLPAFVIKSYWSFGPTDSEIMGYKLEGTLDGKEVKVFTTADGGKVILNGKLVN